MIKHPRLNASNGFVPILLVAGIGLAPLVEIANGLAAPLLPAPARAALLEILVAGLCAVCVVFSLVRAWKSNLNDAFRQTPAPFVLLLFLWSIFGFFHAPYPGFAFAEWLRVVFCLGTFSVAAYGLSKNQRRTVVSGLIVLGAGMAMEGLLQYGTARTSGGTETFGRIIGLFGDSENFGSFLMLLLPLAVGQALNRENPEHLRLGSQAAALLMLITLAVNCTRSAWIGEAAALILMGVLTARNQSPRRTSHRHNGMVFAAAAVTLLAALVIGGSTAMVSRRAISLTGATRLYSFTDRLRKSEAALRMASAQPFTGWGLGTWPVVQQHWTGESDTPAQVFARHDIWSRGGDQQSLAHNFYAQWTAETGAVGLGLYAGSLGAFFFFSLRRLPKLRSPQTRSFLISCIAATTGGCLDALTSPAYNFPGVSGLLWLCIGLGTAASLEA